MTAFIKPYFETEGPFGLPMKDKQAKALVARLREVPHGDAYALRRCSFERGIAEVSPEGRCDVSWITEESPDRAGDIVRARGMDDSHFQLNPIVTLNHAYDQPPVGRSLWRRKVQEGSLVGVKAKTFYPVRPEGWEGDAWPPDYAFELIRAGLLRGKSIGFFPLKLRAPTDAEIDAEPGMKNVRYIIEEWLLAEYACCFLPMQPHAVVEQICKAVPGPVPASFAAALQLPQVSAAVAREAITRVPFTTLREIKRQLPRYVQDAGLEQEIEGALRRGWHKLRGRV